MKLTPFQRGMVTGVLVGWAPLLAFVLVVVLLLNFGSEPEGRRLNHAFAQLRPGMSNAEVEAIMASPGERKETFFLAQRAGYEWEHAAGERVGAAYFLTWSAFDLRITVAFDANDKAIYAARGGT